MMPHPCLPSAMHAGLLLQFGCRGLKKTLLLLPNQTCWMETSDCAFGCC